jgi:hypothetical protein
VLNVFERTARVCLFKIGCQVGARYTDSAMYLTVHHAKTWIARFDFELFHYNRKMRFLKTVPKKFVAKLVIDRPEFNFIPEIVMISPCFERAGALKPRSLFLHSKLYMSETINRVKGNITGSGPYFKDFVKVKFVSGSGAHEVISFEYMQVRGIFHAEFIDPSLNGVFLLGRWCERLSETDLTRQPLLKWEKPIASKEFIPNKFLQFISIDSVVETCTVVPKPRLADIAHDTFDLNDDDRIMWLHTIGRTAKGE